MLFMFESEKENWNMEHPRCDAGEIGDVAQKKSNVWLFIISY